MRLPTNLGRDQSLLGKKWRKSKGGMFATFFSFFENNICKCEKVGPTA